MAKPLPRFVEYVVREILPQIGEYDFRAMMWCYILRSEWITFSILDEDHWYLRTIPETEDWYIKNDCSKFGYIDKKWKEIFMPYFCLPEETFDDVELLGKLIHESVIAAKIAKQSKK